MGMRRVIAISHNQRAIRGVFAQQIHPVDIVIIGVGAVLGIAALNPFLGLLRYQTVVVVGVLDVPCRSVRHHTSYDSRQNLSALIVLVGLAFVIIPSELSFDQAVRAGVALSPQSVSVHGAVEAVVSAHPMSASPKQSVCGGRRIICRVISEVCREGVIIASVPVVTVPVPHPDDEGITKRYSGWHNVAIPQWIQWVNPTAGEGTLCRMRPKLLFGKRASATRPKA